MEGVIGIEWDEEAIAEARKAYGALWGAGKNLRENFAICPGS